MIVRRKKSCPYGLGCPRIEGKDCDKCELATSPELDRALQTIGTMLPGERHWRSVTTSHSANSDPRNPAHDLLKAAERVVELIEESDPDRWDAIASYREALESLKAAIARMHK